MPRAASTRLLPLLCAAGLSLAAGVAQAADTVNLMLNWTPTADHAPLYFARAKGWYKDAGIDLNIEVPAVTAADLILPPPSEGSREVAARVARARDIQARRYADLRLEHVRVNAQASGPMLEEIARADNAGLGLLRDAANAMHLSARGYHRVLRVARTLADLDGAEKVGRIHFAEALSYRSMADDIRHAA